MLLAGPAGSGKTWVLNDLCQFFTLHNEDCQLHVSSFMGIAANNISGSTLHSALNLMRQSSKNHAFAKELKYMWEGVHYIFIDEISMVGCEFLQTINTTLALATGSSLLFGGINVIFCGDMGQLPPIGDTALSTYVNMLLGSSHAKTQNTIKGKLLWLSVPTVIVLQQSLQQSGEENVCFVELLNHLHHGECTMANYWLLKDQIISPTCNVSHWSLPAGDYTPVLVCENMPKDAINLSMSHAFMTDNGSLLHYYVAINTMDGSPITDLAMLQITDLLHSGCTNNWLKWLPLAIGMPVMITTNIDIPGGIVNGSVGQVHSIDFMTLNNGDRVLNHCIVHLPTARAAPMLRLSANEFPIMPSSVPIHYDT